MMKKSLLIIILFFFLQHCGYTPIYSNIKKIDYKINVKELNGNFEMNNIVSSEIKRYSNSSSNKIFNLKVTTTYEKNVLTKNKKGEVTNYLIKTGVIFEIINSKDNLQFVYKEETKASDMNDQFEFKKYENTIKSNFIKSKIEELILNLSAVQ